MPRLEILAAAVLFGTTGTAQALGPDASPVAVGGMRIVVGAVLLAAIAARPAPADPMPARARRLLLVAGAFVAAYQLTFFAAVADTGVAVGTVVALGSGPAFAGGLSYLAPGERATARWAACTALAASGVALLALAGGGGRVSGAGVALALGAGAAYAGYTVLAKTLLDAGHAPERVMAGAFSTGAVLMVPALAVAGVGWVARPGGAALALYLGAVPTALAYVLFARGLRGVRAGDATTLTLAEPLTATALGVLVLGERPGAAAALGAALVLAGLVVLALPGARGADLAAAVGEPLETPAGSASRPRERC